MSGPILVVDDDRERGEMLHHALERDYECSLVPNLDEALAALGKQAWWVALVDYNLEPGDSGLEFLQTLRDLSPRTVRVLYSTWYSPALARDAERAGPTYAVLNARQRGFVPEVRRLLEGLDQEATAAPPAPVMNGDGELPWFAEAPVSREFIERLRDASATTSPVFLHGPLGSGKHVAARLLCAWRQRAIEKGTIATSRGTVILRVPSLEERRPDLPALVGWELARQAQLPGGRERRLGPGVMEHLLERRWHGSVRELQVALAAACKHAGSRAEIQVADLPRGSEPAVAPSQYRKDEGQREAILRQLRAAGSVRGAADLEGIPRPNYIRLMRRLGVIRADTLADGED